MVMNNKDGARSLDNSGCNLNAESYKDTVDICEETIFRLGTSCREIIDMAPGMVWILDKDYNIIYANQALLWYAGCNAEDFVKHKWMELIHPEDMLYISKKIKYTTNLKKSSEHEMRFLRFDGIYLWHRVKVNTFRDSEGDFAGYIGINTDINELKEAKEILTEAKEAAEAANIAKSEFLANMSHELRTPINGIGGMIDLTLLTNLTEEQRYKLTTAKECVNSLIHTINDILDYEKLESDKISLENHVFNVREMVDDIINVHGPMINRKGLIFNTTISPDLPMYLYGDSTKLIQVIHKLLDNACKFTQNGSITLSVNMVSWQENKVLIKFCVMDTGIGIAKVDQRGIFNSFCQVEGSYARRFGGTGLGLAISKKLVELMGGIISVESDKDEGSTFYFFLEFTIDETEVLNTPMFTSHPDTNSKIQYDTSTSSEYTTTEEEIHDHYPEIGEQDDAKLNELELDLNIMESAIRYDNPEIIRFMLKEILEIARELRIEEIAHRISQGIEEYEKCNMKGLKSKLRGIREMIEQRKKD